MSVSKSSISTLVPKTDGDTELKLLIERFKSDYERADLFCKKVQHFRDQAGIPAINEMRYAGYHLSLAHDVDGVLSNVPQINKARAHAQRAIYEAAEAGILRALREIEAFKKDYVLVSITDVVKDWLEILAFCKTARSCLGVQREVGDDRSLDHDKHFEIFTKASEYAERLEESRAELNKKMANERRLSRRFVTTVTISITAMVSSASIAFIIYLIKQ